MYFFDINSVIYKHCPFGYILIHQELEQMKLESLRDEKLIQQIRENR